MSNGNWLCCVYAVNTVYGYVDIDKVEPGLNRFNINENELA